MHLLARQTGLTAAIDESLQLLKVHQQAADSIGSEAHAGGRDAALPIENASHDVIGVMDGEAANQSNCLLVGASGGSAARRQTRRAR